MLILTRKEQEAIKIGDNIEIVVTSIGDGQVRIGINAPREITILRKEVIEEITNSNMESIVEVDSVEEIISKL